MSLKIYTKTGDGGQTAILGGPKRSKADLRVDAYGHVDELNAYIGHLSDHLETWPKHHEQLRWLQVQLFNAGSVLATAPGFKEFTVPSIAEDAILNLENWIDEMEEELPELKNFILPCGHKIVSLCHVCRTVCRRSERQLVALNAVEVVEIPLLPFFNRLSDYLFVLARFLSKETHTKEVLWTPNKV